MRPLPQLGYDDREFAHLTVEPGKEYFFNGMYSVEELEKFCCYIRRQQEANALYNPNSWQLGFNQVNNSEL